MTETLSLRRRAMVAFFWSMLQNWGGRTLGVVVFVMLARLVEPSEFGLAASAFLVLQLLALVAEFGLGDALIQRQGLKPADVNLPFYVAVGMSMLLAAAAAFFSADIAAVMDVEGLAPYLIATAAICPLLTLSSFQDALYRRELMFKPLAVRTLAGIVLGGIVGIGMALTGFGTWALIAQYAVQTLTSVVWLWMRPAWKPSRELHVTIARQLAKFGSNVVAFRLVDFLTLRSIDFIILVVYGPAALGLFTVSSRLYQLLLQLLQSSINGVALSMLSQVASDRQRVSRLYLRSASICATFGTPVFFGLAALTPEVTHLMFGSRWAGADAVMAPLLLMGGVHCIQFINGSYLTALGKPDTLLRLVILKALLVLPPLYFIRLDNVAQTTMLFVVSLIVLTPFSFGATLQAVSLRGRDLIAPVVAPVLACSLAFGAVALARYTGQVSGTSDFINLILFGLVFTLTYVAALGILAFRSTRDNLTFVLGAVKR